MAKKTESVPAAGGPDRRRSQRKQVLDTFQVFLVVPKHGSHKIYLRDLSEHGLGFTTDPIERFRSGDTVECFFYMNPSLKLPLTIRVAHVTADPESGFRVGCQFTETESKAYLAYLSFVRLLDELTPFLGPIPA